MVSYLRRIAVFERLTPEGHFTDAQGNEQNLFVRDAELDKDLMANATAGTYLFGRRTYEHMAAFWPHAVKDPNLPPAMKKMAKMLNEDEKIVFSRTMKDAGWKNTRILSKLDPEEIRKMKQGRGPDFLVMGSGSIVSQLTQHGLVDDYWFVVGPVLSGGGHPLFEKVTSTTPLQLMECKSYPSGNVLLKYRRTDASQSTGLHD